MPTFAALFPLVTSCKRVGALVVEATIIPLGLVAASFGVDAIVDLLV